MTFVELFEDHLKLAGRVAARRPLRTGRKDIATPWLLCHELKALESTKDFDKARRTAGAEYDQAKYAVDALLDQISTEAFGAPQNGQDGWVRLNPDPNVGHNFYDHVEKIADGGSRCRMELLELYLLCELLGFRGDENARSQKVKDAFGEVLDGATALKCPIEWKAFSTPHHFDFEVAASQRVLRTTLVMTILIYSGFLLAMWFAWIGFPRS